MANLLHNCLTYNAKHNASGIVVCLQGQKSLFPPAAGDAVSTLPPLAMPSCALSRGLTLGCAEEHTDLCTLQSYSLSQRAERGLITVHPQLINHACSDKYFWACCIRGARKVQVTMQGLVGWWVSAVPALLAQMHILEDDLKLSCKCQSKTEAAKSLLL